MKGGEEQDEALFYNILRFDVASSSWSSSLLLYWGTQSARRRSRHRISNIRTQMYNLHKIIVPVSPASYIRIPIYAFSKHTYVRTKKSYTYVPENSRNQASMVHRNEKEILFYVCNALYTTVTNTNTIIRYSWTKLMDFLYFFFLFIYRIRCSVFFFPFIISMYFPRY